MPRADETLSQTSPTKPHLNVTDAAKTLAVSHVLAVCAHPDDESFGLGGVIAALVAAGTRVDLICLTGGEASTCN